MNNSTSMKFFFALFSFMEIQIIHTYIYFSKIYFYNKPMNLVLHSTDVQTV